LFVDVIVAKEDGVVVGTLEEEVVGGVDVGVVVGIQADAGLFEGGGGLEGRDGSYSIQTVPGGVEEVDFGRGTILYPILRIYAISPPDIFIAIYL